VVEDMIQTTYQSRPLWILDLPHDGRGPFRCEFEVMAHVETGLSNREERRALACHLRTRISFGLIAQDGDARRLEAALHACGKDRVAVPLWPAAVLWGARASARIRGGLQLVFRGDWSQWEVFEDVEPGWPLATDTVVPLVVGRLEERTLRWIHPDACEFAVNHVEASPAKWSLRVAGVEWQAGPMPAGYSQPPRLFPLGAQFDQPSGTVTVSIAREGIGFGREPIEESYQDIGAMQRESGSIEVGEQIATALRWTLDHAAGRSFWMPRPTSALRIPDGMFDGQTAAIATDTYGVRPGDWVAFLDVGMRVRTFSQIASTSGSIVRFSTPPGVVRPDDFITRLELVRFTRPRVVIEWFDVDVASVTFPVRAVPVEEAVPEDEEIGFSLGNAWHRVWLYEFSRTVAGVTEVERVTSHEEDIELDGVTYTAARVDHGAIVRGIALDRDEVEIRGSLEDLAMVRDLAAVRSEATVKVRILEASITRLRQFSADFEPDAFQ
jgi:hypothetical protein